MLTRTTSLRFSDLVAKKSLLIPSRTFPAGSGLYLKQAPCVSPTSLQSLRRIRLNLTGGSSKSSCFLLSIKSTEDTLGVSRNQICRLCLIAKTSIKTFPPNHLGGPGYPKFSLGSRLFLKPSSRVADSLKPTSV